MPTGIATAVASATITRVPTIAGPIPVGAPVDEEFDADRPGAAPDHREDDDRQHPDREHGRRGGAVLGGPAEDLPPAQVAAGPQRRRRVEAGVRRRRDRLSGAHLETALR